MRVAIELSIVAKRKRVSLGVIEMNFNVKSAVQAAIDADEELTERERQVLNGMLRGLVHKEIAAEMHISDRTVKFHAASLYKRYGVTGRGALIYKLTRTREVVK